MIGPYFEFLYSVVNTVLMRINVSVMARARAGHQRAGVAKRLTSRRARQRHGQPWSEFLLLS